MDYREEWLPAGLGCEVCLAKTGSVGCYSSFPDISWQLVSTTITYSMASELHCAAAAELDAWAQSARGFLKYKLVGSAY